MIADSFTIASNADSATLRPWRRLERQLSPALALRPRLRPTPRLERANRSSTLGPGMRRRTRLDSRMLQLDRQADIPPPPPSGRALAQLGKQNGGAVRAPPCRFF